MQRVINDVIDVHMSGVRTFFGCVFKGMESGEQLLNADPTKCTISDDGSFRKVSSTYVMHGVYA